MASDDFDFQIELAAPGPFQAGETIRGSLTLRARRSTRTKLLRVALRAPVSLESGLDPLERGGRDWRKDDVQRVDFEFELPPSDALGYRGELFNLGCSIDVEVEVEWEENSRTSLILPIAPHGSGLSFGRCEAIANDLTWSLATLTPIAWGLVVGSAIGFAFHVRAGVVVGVPALIFLAIWIHVALDWRARRRHRGATLEVEMHNDTRGYRDAPQARPIVARVVGLGSVPASGQATLRLVETLRTGEDIRRNQRVECAGELTFSEGRPDEVIARFALPSINPLPYSFEAGIYRVHWEFEMALGGTFGFQKRWIVEALPTVRASTD